MELDDYFECISSFAKSCATKAISPQNLIENIGLDNQEVQNCIKFRTGLVNPQEEEYLNAYLEVGHFLAGSNRLERISLFALCFDIQNELDRQNLKQQSEPYDKEQKLFLGAPKLFENIRSKSNSQNLDYELIDLNAIRSQNNSEIYRVDSGYVKLTHLLNPGIINWATQSFPSSPIFVRLDPHYFSKELPLQYLAETTLVPANPKWLKDFSLRKGMKDFASYILLDVSAAEDQHQFWDYRFKGIRRLEVRVERREDDYLTMMIEELPKEDDPNGLMVGRCIHLDTSDPEGTPLRKVRLKHLDLAVNVYEGSSRATRFSQSLKDGKVVDASFRTHLFRIEDAHFESVFGFCRAFLNSQYLFGEWIQDVIAEGRGNIKD